MGFTIVGPNRFLGSGHPDLRDDLPPLLGLIESTNRGPLHYEGRTSEGHASIPGHARALSRWKLRGS
jgi:hypothetical protein